MLEWIFDGGVALGLLLLGIGPAYLLRAAVRFAFRSTGAAPDRALDAVEVAYLRGGLATAIDVATARLVDAHELTVENGMVDGVLEPGVEGYREAPSARRLRAVPTRKRPAFDEAVLHEVRHGGPMPFYIATAVTGSVALEAKALRDRLTQEGWWLSPTRRVGMRLGDAFVVGFVLWCVSDVMQSTLAAFALLILLTGTAVDAVTSLAEGRIARALGASLLFVPTLIASFILYPLWIGFIGAFCLLPLVLTSALPDTSRRTDAMLARLKANGPEALDSPHRLAVFGSEGFRDPRLPLSARLRRLLTLIGVEEKSRRDTTRWLRWLRLAWSVPRPDDDMP